MWPLVHLLEAWTVYRTKFPTPGETDTALFRLGVRLAPTPDLLAKEALTIAISQIGKGESGGNNMGPDVARYISPAKTPQNWCAGLIGYCYDVAAFQLGIPLPFKRSLGAKALGKNIAKIGRRFTDPLEALPGDAMVFYRGMTGSWQGHIAMVERVLANGDVLTIEGNSGPKVRRMTRRVDGKDRFAFFASVRKDPPGGREK